MVNLTCSSILLQKEFPIQLSLVPKNKSTLSTPHELAKNSKKQHFFRQLVNGTEFQENSQYCPASYYSLKQEDW